MPRRLNNLCKDLQDKYSLTGNLNDLEEAIDYFKQAVSLTDTESPNLPMYLNNLGLGLNVCLEMASCCRGMMM